jgi:hypothetical protein
MWHGYFGIENLGLNATQRGTLVDALRALGPASAEGLKPSVLNHRRTRLDGEAVIFEALFDENDITVDAFKGRLGSVFGVAPATIDHAVTRVTWHHLESAVVTFSRSGVSYLRVVFFGYKGARWPSWKESRLEALAYLAANAVAWEEPIP